MRAEDVCAVDARRRCRRSNRRKPARSKNPDSIGAVSRQAQSPTSPALTHELQLCARRWCRSRTRDTPHDVAADGWSMIRCRSRRAATLKLTSPRSPPDIWNVPEKVASSPTVRLSASISLPCALRRRDPQVGAVPATLTSRRLIRETKSPSMSLSLVPTLFSVRLVVPFSVQPGPAGWRLRPCRRRRPASSWAPSTPVAWLNVNSWPSPVALVQDGELGEARPPH